MKINVKEETMVKPAEKTPRRSLRLSDLDLLYDQRHIVIVYFYKPKGASNFFEAIILKEALRKVLVPFYPLAGRLRHDDDDGRLEIDCNEEGVKFIEAESNSILDDFGDFVPTPELRGQLVPTIDYSAGISSYPLVLLQVTYFKCGGVCLSVAMEDRLADGPAALHFVNSWSEIARGMDLTIPPFLDRTVLHPRSPPQIIFNHNEYQLPQVNSSSEQEAKSQYDIEGSMTVILKITREQVNKLKTKAQEEEGNTINFSTFEILAGHIWKCTCIARALLNNQETMLFFPANGRYSNKLEPSLPPGYFGSAVFQAKSVAKAGDLKSKPLCYAASVVHQSLNRLDKKYLKSVLHFLKLNPNIKRYGRGSDYYTSPNLTITSWVKLPTHDADFGWGQPCYVGPGVMLTDGRFWILPNAAKDGSLSVFVPLQPDQLSVFKKLFYEIDEKEYVRNSVGYAKL